MALAIMVGSMFIVAVVAYDLGIRLPWDMGFPVALVGALGLASWGLISRLSDDEHAHHHH